jgi:peptidyl-prolyl cis-trans isomerase D
LRADLLTSQFVEATTSSAFTTAAEIAAIAALQGQVRDFEYIVVDAELLAEGFVPDDGAVKQEYESDSNRFMEPEKVKVELVRLSLETLMKGVDVDEVALESLYAEQRSRYVREEQRRARHILLELAEDAGQSKVDEVMAEMRSLRERIVAGESFEELAAAHSADPGSREQGGDLGFFGRGTMVAAFDESVFSLQPGELSEPVRTPFGLHLIRLESVNEGEVKPFSEVRSEVEESYRRQLAEKQIVDQLDLMTSIAFESPSSLDELVRTLGLEVEQSDWFSRQGGQGLFAEKMLRDAAFDPDVLEAGHNSVPVELKGEGYVVLRLIDRKPASKKPLGEVREEIATILIEREGARLAGEEAERLLAAAVAGAKLADLAGQEGGLELKVLSGVTRDAPQGAPAPLLKRVFAMARPDGGSRSLDQVELARGDRAVVELQSVAEGDADDSTAMAEQRAATIGREEFGGLMDGLKSRAKIEIFSRVLNEESL